MVRFMIPLVLALFAATSVGTSPAAAASPSVPAAGTMILHADRSTGVSLTGLPKEMSFDVHEHLDLQLHGASFGVVLLDTGEEMCGETEAVICPRAGRFNFGGPAGDVYPEGVGLASPDVITTDGTADVYIVADGPVTATLRVVGLPGKAALKLRGKVDAVVERLPAGCAVTDCAQLRYGGATHELGGGGGFASAFAMSWNPQETPVPGMGNVVQTNSVIPCAYPHWRTPDASPDPEAHPTGCDFVQEDGTIAEQHIDNAANFTIQAADGSIANARVFPNFAARGEVYLGYVAERYNPFEPMVAGGGVEAFGVWLHDGITCPASNCVVTQ